VTGERASLPVLTIDFDGVICSPPFGVNLGITTAFLDPTAPPRAARVPPRWLGDALDHLRFDFRRPMPEAAAALAALHRRRRVVVLTGRRSSPLPWLRRYHLDSYVDDIAINEGTLRSAHHKLESIERLGVREHVDDDGRTAQLLAVRAGVTVYLRDWPRNRGAAYANGVVRVTDLAEVAARIDASGGAELDER
jgi:uncharacterized HAD superfamily protein